MRVVRAGVAGDKEDVGYLLYCFSRSPSPTFSGNHLVKTEFTVRKQKMFDKSKRIQKDFFKNYIIIFAC